MKLGRRTCLMFAAAVLLFSSVAFVQPADAVYTPPVSTLKIGLAYGSGTLSVAKVEAEVGSGFLFGYYDDNRSFVQVGYTDKTRLTFLKDHNMYQSGESYSSSGNGNLIGCYHALLNESFLSIRPSSKVPTMPPTSTSPKGALMPVSSTERSTSNINDPVVQEALLSK